MKKTAEHQAVSHLNLKKQSTEDKLSDCSVQDWKKWYMLLFCLQRTQTQTSLPLRLPRLTDPARNIWTWGAQLTRRVLIWNRKETLLLTDIQANRAELGKLVWYQLHTVQTARSPLACIPHSPVWSSAPGKGKKEWALIAGKHSSGSDLTMLHKG